MVATPGRDAADDWKSVYQSVTCLVPEPEGNLCVFATTAVADLSENPHCRRYQGPGIPQAMPQYRIPRHQRLTMIGVNIAQKHLHLSCSFASHRPLGDDVELTVDRRCVFWYYASPESVRSCRDKTPITTTQYATPLRRVIVYPLTISAFCTGREPLDPRSSSSPLFDFKGMCDVQSTEPFTCLSCLLK